MYFYYFIGQPHLRSEDRFRHITSDRIRVTAAHPFKHKHSSEQGRTLEERRKRALSKSLVNADRMTSRFSVPESPTSTWSPTASPAHLSSNAVIDEPLALVKKMHPDTEDDNNKNAVRHIQCYYNVYIVSTHILAGSSLSDHMCLINKVSLYASSLLQAPHCTNLHLSRFSSTCSLLSLQITKSSANIIVQEDSCLTSSDNWYITIANRKGLRADP
ncbi:hypothetical protein QTP70_027713 [Hemibagrus guttatus]|uniref:Uncharacterized protein n=1 Tax=Hemibagrus guttatus TaxID=175788 RepID=A0AAE0V6I4_9TELE|nr:hypothetical protein QTP70_027713 [Hemibagrus guttatus]